MARTDLTQDKSTLNLSTYSTVSIAPGSNRVVLAFVFNVRSGVAQAAQPTAQGNGLTWQAAASIQVAGAPNRRLTCFSATGAAPTPGPLSFDFGGEQQTLCAWSVFEYDGVAGIAQIKTASGGAPTPTVTLDPLADANKSVVVGGVIANSLFGTPAQVQPAKALLRSTSRTSPNPAPVARCKPRSAPEAEPRSIGRQASPRIGRQLRSSSR